MMAGNLNLVESISIPTKILVETRAFLVSRGVKGYEGLVFWIGKRTRQGHAVVTKVYIPKEQVARRTPLGVSVELPAIGFSKLLDSTAPDEIILVKVHSHPREAFLSVADAANHMFRFEGAVQIIVPDFCRRPLDTLGHCAVLRFWGGKWTQLAPKEISAIFHLDGVNGN